MILFKYTAKCFWQYSDFRGRATRSEFWYFQLFNVIVGFVVGLIAGFIMARLSGDFSSKDYSFLAIYNFYSLVVVLPSFAVSVRRLHDTGKSGWWIFINCIPVVGWIIYLVWMFTDSQPGTNKWGETQKG